MKIKAKIGDIVEVLWIDTYTADGWIDRLCLDLGEERGRCTTVGYFVDLNDDAIVVAPTEHIGAGECFPPIAAPWRIPLPQVRKVNKVGKRAEWK